LGAKQLNIFKKSKFLSSISRFNIEYKQNQFTTDLWDLRTLVLVALSDLIIQRKIDKGNLDWKRESTIQFLISHLVMSPKGYRLCSTNLTF
jgi:hypothetical protein